MRLIDADALKVELQDIKSAAVSVFGKDRLAEYLIQEELNLLNRQPTIDPVKHGLWLEERIKIPNPDTTSDSDNLEVVQCRCSECGRLLTLNYTYSTRLFRFCPGCGSNMQG